MCEYFLCVCECDFQVLNIEVCDLKFKVLHIVPLKPEFRNCSMMHMEYNHQCQSVYMTCSFCWFFFFFSKALCVFCIILSASVSHFLLFTRFMLLKAMLYVNFNIFCFLGADMPLEGNSQSCFVSN